jgi:indolepyruvate ferredoxin oxidoreductase
MSFGPWVFTAFRILARLKSLRGTRFDPFGWMAERRTERRLIEEYEAAVDVLLRSLSPANVEAATAIAALPMRITGFGPIKTARIAEVKASEKELLAAFRRRDGQSEPATPQLVAAE